MSTKEIGTVGVEFDVEYALLECMVQAQVRTVRGPVFTTDASPGDLWVAYLSNIPEVHRQYYNCHTCWRFIQRYGGLVTVDEDGAKTPLLWLQPAALEGGFELFRPSLIALWTLVSEAKITGVFLSADAVWGTPMTGVWSHLSGDNPSPVVVGLKTCNQLAAEKSEDYGILCRSVADYGPDVAAQAARILAKGGLYRSEKAVAVATWFNALHARIEGVRGDRRTNLLWRAVATAPTGFCHVRTQVIGTLMDDVAAGTPFETVAERWAAKLHPLQYQRPTAAPTEGQIDAAEREVTAAGIAPAFVRRYATLADVQVKIWTPTTAPAPVKPAGVFADLRGGGKGKSGVVTYELPATSMTWDKFQRTILPTAHGLEYCPRNTGPFYALVTAVDPAAPPIVQWDGLDGLPRNPVTWYVYHGHVGPVVWNLTTGVFTSVTAVFAGPYDWHAEGRFAHQGKRVFLALAGCRDTCHNACGLALFPEVLKAEYRGMRAVIEAYSNRNKGGLQGYEEGDANGIVLTSGTWAPVLLRARTAAGDELYNIDRLD